MESHSSNKYKVSYIGTLRSSAFPLKDTSISSYRILLAALDLAIISLLLPAAPFPIYRLNLFTFPRGVAAIIFLTSLPSSWILVREVLEFSDGRTF